MGYRNHLPRHESDDYQTNLELTRAICQRLSALIAPPQKVIEPSAGLGRFIIATREQWPNSYITGLDCRQECVQTMHQAKADNVVIGDWSDPTTEALQGPFDLIIGNPPYYVAEEHVHLAKTRLAPGGALAFLLRMAFLSSQQRVKTLWQPPSELKYLMPLAQRASFTEDGKTEHSEYAVYVWEKGFMGDTKLLPHLWYDTPSKRSSRAKEQQVSE